MKTFIGLIMCSFLLLCPMTGWAADEAAATHKKEMKGMKHVQHMKKSVTLVPDEKTKAVQEALNKQGFKLKVDGLMGGHTKAVLKKYQKKQGLTVTGIPDKATLDKLGIM